MAVTVELRMAEFLLTLQRTLSPLLGSVALAGLGAHWDFARAEASDDTAMLFSVEGAACFSPSLAMSVLGSTLAMQFW